MTTVIVKTNELLATLVLMNLYGIQIMQIIFRDDLFGAEKNLTQMQRDAAAEPSSTRLPNPNLITIL